MQTTKMSCMLFFKLGLFVSCNLRGVSRAHDTYVDSGLMLWWIWKLFLCMICLNSDAISHVFARSNKNEIDRGRNQRPRPESVRII